MKNRAVSTQTAAEILSVSAFLVRRWADEGLLPSFRLPSGHRRFALSAVLAFRDRLLSTAGQRPA
jgi:excisionase family DNA binding protein